MSVANCPETPRQKMISLMYLVLTAMLAINLPPQVLESFDLVNKGLDVTKTNFEGRNKSLYSMFSEQSANNKAKVGPLYNKALEIKQKSDSMVQVIQDVKIQLTKGASRELIIDPDSLTESYYSDADVGPRLMLEPAKGGSDLHRSYYEYKESIKESLLGQPGLADVIANVDNLLTVNNPDVPNAKEWEYKLFEGRPVIASITMLTKLQNDIRNIEALSLQKLFDQIGASDFKMNKIDVIVKPESAYVIRGGVVKASVIVAAYDSTSTPQVLVDNKPLENGVMSYTIPTQGASVGMKQSKVIVNLDDPENVGKTKSYEGILNYQVVEPTATVSAVKMNVVYVGVKNPLQISVPGVADNQVVVQSSVGDIKADPSSGAGKYVIILPTTAIGKVCQINVSAIMDGKTTFVAKSDFRVKKLPDPVAYIPNGDKDFTGGGRISRSVLLSTKALLAKLKDAEFDSPFEIKNFVLNTQDAMGNSKEVSSNGANFSAEQMNLLKKARKGDKIFISKIVAVGADRLDRKLQAMDIEIN